MKSDNKVILLTVLTFCLSVSSMAQVNFPGGRIAVDTDGNYHDHDDWAATPMGIFMLHIACLEGNLVHYGFSSHLGTSSGAAENEMVISSLGSAQRFNVDESVFFDDYADIDASVNHLRDQINASSATDRLYLIIGGPMEVAWRALNAADQDKRQYVTAISHSNWNENHEHGDELTHTWLDIKALPGGLVTRDISDQNNNLRSPYSDWQWLASSADPDLNWLWDRINSTGKSDADVSDSGMTWYLITGLGQENGSPEDVRALYDAGCSGPCVTVADCPTMAGGCQEYECVSQQCALLDVAQGTACDEDGDLCTIDECNGAGQCQTASNVSCDVPPLGECDSGEVCNSGTGSCELQPISVAGTSCNEDGDLCTVDECDGFGACVNIGPLTCSDGNVCTDDACDATQGCVAVPNVVPCDDGLACTDSDICASGVCAGADSCSAGESCSSSTGVCEESIFDLSLSTFADRSSPLPLEGMSVAGEIFVFVDPETGASQVEFFLDDTEMLGSPVHSESNAPWDFAGGSVATANPFDTTTIPDGVHTITIGVSLMGGGTEVVSRSFTVMNTGPVPDPPQGVVVN